MDMDMDVDTDRDREAATTPPGPAPSTPTGGALAAGGGGGGGHGKLTEPRRRNRPALSCIQCRTRKIRCDRNEPCASCLKSKIVNCTYEEARRPKPRLWRLSPAPAAAQSDNSPTAEQRLAADSGYTYKEVSLAPAPVPGPVATSAATANTTTAVAAGTATTPSSASTTSTSTSTTTATIAALSPPSHPTSYRDPGPRSSSATTKTSTTTILTARTGEPVSAPTPAIRHLELTPSHSASGFGNSTAALAERVQQLEQQLAEALRNPDRPQHTSQNAHVPLHCPQGSGSKTCLANGDKFFPLIINLAKRIESDRDSDIYFLLKKCKDLCRVIKSQKVPPHVGFQLGSDVPHESVARRLAEAYFRTFESVYRILHQPSFWREYNHFWENRTAASPAFIAQFQLCMAIGTCFQDDVAALRPSAAQWIYEAQAWLASPCEKARLNMSGLQTMCLLHIARETCGVECDLTWISAGPLLRTAMYMGLHRDPDSLPAMSVFRAEMRRRLWATVLEMTLQSSLDSGGPPLISVSDYDTRPPSNYDDDQLCEGDKPPPNPRSPGTFTQTSVQLALLRSFPTRLAIAQYVNHFKAPATYEETLKWNTELTAACRALSATLQQSYDPAGILPRRLSLFQLRLAEHMVHRFFLALNHPWLWSAQHNPAYYFARKMCVETSLKLYRAFATGSPAGDSGTARETDDFTRLSTCGYGAFRSVPTLAVLTICLELLWQVQEDRSFRQSMNLDHVLERPGSEADLGTTGPLSIGSGAAPRQDLLDAVKYSIGWTVRRIRMGETNIKGYLMYSALWSQVQALQNGASDAEAEEQVLASIADELGQCWHLLQEAAGGKLALSMIGAALNGGYGPGRSPFEDSKMDYSYGWDSEGSVSGECKTVKILLLTWSFSAL
ncbi:Putative transcription factor [Podospora comata]|uniref:Transcription factor n=1 Tax=Podospora comata TaxID=48703 RepID=A0ABY6S598_PODCO|nr:Putative transcription factor [Podospora comata]